MNLSASTLLSWWETGASCAPPARPAALLAALAGEPVEVAARLPLGQRDARLLEWYVGYAGARLEALADCPQCHGPVELEFDAADVRRPAGPGTPVSVAEDGWVLSWRPPDTYDFCQAAAAATAGAARQVLLERCLTACGGEGDQAPPEHLVSRLLDLGAASDPQADVQLELKCPACDAAWQTPFDIGAFLWARLQAEAVRLLAEVRELAAACAWSEADILALSSARRAAYLQLTRSA